MCIFFIGQLAVFYFIKYESVLYLLEDNNNRQLVMIATAETALSELLALHVLYRKDGIDEEKNVNTGR